MKILLCSMPDTVPQFSAKTWRAPNLAISSIAGNIQPHHEVILAALFIRVNIPVAIAASWITNPLTAPVIYPLQYRLGLWLSGAPNINELAGYTGMLRIYFRYAMPLWVGSLISATCSSILVYAGISSAWWLVSKVRGKFFYS